MTSRPLDFGMKPLAPNSRDFTTTAASSCAETITYRNLRVLAAQQDQPGEAIGTRHVQVQQDQVPVGFFAQAGFQFGDARHFNQAYIGAQAEGNGLAQALRNSGWSSAIRISYVAIDLWILFCARRMRGSEALGGELAPRMASTAAGGQANYPAVSPTLACQPRHYEPK
jgi:hypothetical protein